MIRKKPVLEFNEIITGLYREESQARLRIGAFLVPRLRLPEYKREIKLACLNLSAEYDEAHHALILFDIEKVRE